MYLWIGPHPTVFATQVWIHGMYACLYYSNWVMDCWCCWMTSVYSIQTQWEWRTFVPEQFIITAWGRVLNKLLVAQLVRIVAHSVEYEVPSHIRKSLPFVHILSQMDQVRVHPSARRSCARDAFPSFQLWLFWAVRATCLVHCTMLWSAKYLASKTNCETSQSEFCPASCYFLLFQMFISPNITSW